MATVQFSVLPSFQTLVLPDNSPLDDAINYILLTLRKSDTAVSEEVCKSYSEAISAQTGVQSIGDLRVFTDADFRALQVPAMLRIYLKYLVRGTQSGRGQKSPDDAPTTTSTGGSSEDDALLVSLQNEFNYGSPFDLTQYQSSLDTLALMGFSSGASMEALCIVENKSVEAACELLLSTDAAQRKEKRARTAERLGRQARDASNATSPSATTTRTAESDPTSSLQTELSLARSQLSSERSARVAQSVEYRTFIETTLPLKIYVEYLKSVLVKEYLLPIELDHLDKYRARNRIDGASHLSALAELGIESPAALESLVKKVDKNRGGGPGAGGNVQQPGDMDCVVCLDKPKTYLIQNCNHLCLCEDCADSWMRKKGAANTFSQNCPICSKKITHITRVYM